MTVVNSERSPNSHPTGYIVLAQAANGDITLVGTAVFLTQHEALTALEDVAEDVVATTKYFIVHLDVISGILATYSA